ncbi:hypothetical protein TDB9533_03327 [Thalassocella blandensis]|nr:hypothetical protein TDB9533_03327 [Thalassocella blandensis]
MKPRISCDLHDYIEIACMYKIPVSLTLKDGRVLSGKPITTTFNRAKEECILFFHFSSEEEEHIPLYLLEIMASITPNVHFNTVVFE